MAIHDEKTDILLVDDKSENLLSLSAILESPELNLIQALSGEEALEKAWVSNPALVLLDVQMPGIDGFEVARLLRGSAKTRGIPIIFVTATHGEEKFTFLGFESGAVDYLFKPLNPIIVRSKVNIFVELHRNRMRLESALHRLSLINKELESFAYSVSHDLRSPVRAVTWFASSMMKSKKTDEEHLQQIVDAAKTMDGMIDGFLSLSKVTQTEFKPTRVDLSALCTKIFGELRRVSPEREVTFTVSDGIFANGDPALLDLALRNLLTNAMKYTSKAPSPKIEIGANESSVESSFFIRDNGVGFDMAYGKRLFTPFQRLHSVNDFPGTGIGLATVQRVVHRHGGRIWAESEVGKGATFFFTLNA